MKFVFSSEHFSHDWYHPSLPPSLPVCLSVCVCVHVRVHTEHSVYHVDELMQWRGGCTRFGPAAVFNVQMYCPFYSDRNFIHISQQICYDDMFCGYSFAHCRLNGLNWKMKHPSEMSAPRSELRRRTPSQWAWSRKCFSSRAALARYVTKHFMTRL